MANKETKMKPIDYAYYEGIKNFNLSDFKQFLKKWDNSGYKMFKRISVQDQTRLLANEIVKNEKELNEEIVAKAKKWLANHQNVKKEG